VGEGIYTRERESRMGWVLMRSEERGRMRSNVAIYVSVVGCGSSHHNGLELHIHLCLFDFPLQTSFVVV
jgi:hypothetical protein